MTAVRGDGDRDVAEAYDAWAQSYDEQVNATRDLDARVLRSLGLDLAGRRVLEVGCGTGKNTRWLAQEAAEVVAMDFSGGMLERARARVTDGRVRWVRHDLRQSWPLEDGSVDLVVVDLVLEHVEELEPVFLEAFRVLAGGGEIFVCELHPARQRAGVQARFADPGTGETVLVPAYLHQVEDYAAAARAAGFGDVATQDWFDSEPSGTTDVPRLVSLRARKPGGTG